MCAYDWKEVWKSHAIRDQDENLFYLMNYSKIAVLIEKAVKTIPAFSIPTYR